MKSAEEWTRELLREYIRIDEPLSVDGMIFAMKKILPLIQEEVLVGLNVVWYVHPHHQENQHPEVVFARKHLTPPIEWLGPFTSDEAATVADRLSILRSVFDSDYFPDDLAPTPKVVKKDDGYIHLYKKGGSKHE